MKEDHTQFFAERDLSDISALKRVPGFERYFLRRLRERRDVLAAKVLDDDTISPVEREAARQAYKELKDICDMPGKDEATATRIIRDARAK